MTIKKWAFSASLLYAGSVFASDLSLVEVQIRGNTQPIYQIFLGTITKQEELSADVWKKISDAQISKEEGSPDRKKISDRNSISSILRAIEMNPDHELFLLMESQPGTKKFPLAAHSLTLIDGSWGSDEKPFASLTVYLVIESILPKRNKGEESNYEQILAYIGPEKDNPWSPDSKLERVPLVATSVRPEDREYFLDENKKLHPAKKSTHPAIAAFESELVPQSGLSLRLVLSGETPEKWNQGSFSGNFAIGLFKGGKNLIWLDGRKRVEDYNHVPSIFLRVTKLKSKKTLFYVERKSHDDCPSAFIIDATGESTPIAVGCEGSSC